MAGCTLSRGIYLSRTELKEDIYSKMGTSNGIKEHTKSVKSFGVFFLPVQKGKIKVKEERDDGERMKKSSRNGNKKK